MNNEEKKKLNKKLNDIFMHRTPTDLENLDEKIRWFSITEKKIKRYGDTHRCCMEDDKSIIVDEILSYPVSDKIDMTVLCECALPPNPYPDCKICNDTGKIKQELMLKDINIKKLMETIIEYKNSKQKSSINAATILDKLMLNINVDNLCDIKIKD